MAAILSALNLGDLRRVTPIDSSFGLNRGQPVDRHYIEDFLGRHSRDVRGHVLEVAEDTYTQRFGGVRVTKSDILHADGSNERATVVADLADGDTSFEVPGRPWADAYVPVIDTTAPGGQPVTTTPIAAGTPLPLLARSVQLLLVRRD